MQPIPTRPRPFARQRLTEDLLSTRTPAIRKWALDEFRTFESDGQFVPFGVNVETVIFPGFDGGAEWGGQAFDPDTGLYYVNANDLAWTGALEPDTGGFSGRALFLRHCASCHGDTRAGSPPTIPSIVDIAARRTFGDVVRLVREGVGRMPGLPDLDQESVNAIVQFAFTGEDTPAPGTGRRGRAGRGSGPPPGSPLINNSFRFTGYRRFMDPDGFPAVAPPWGTLNAIDLNTGEYAWTVPLGEYPELVAQGLRNTGSENYGGPVVTAGGLVFIGATNADRKLRAFDKTTGALLWETVMDGPGRATPATYEAGGRQFVLIATGSVGGGRGAAPAGAAAGQRTSVYVAFALPR
jgi:quinoprotein glucose dehydrogenase